MSSETPLTTAQVEDGFAQNEWDVDAQEEEKPRRERFRRWLAAELAAAWAEGHDAGWDERDEFVHYGAIPSGIHQSAAVNPYRDQAEEGR